jgi:hypothetical protein
MSVPTATEFIENDYYHLHLDTNSTCLASIHDAMIEFAKLHVEAALEAASETEIVSGTSYKHRTNLDMDIIMNSYPLEKIK